MTRKDVTLALALFVLAGLFVHGLAVDGVWITPGVFAFAFAVLWLLRHLPDSKDQSR
jgi:hypothetical protein